MVHAHVSCLAEGKGHGTALQLAAGQVLDLTDKCFESKGRGGPEGRWFVKMKGVPGADARA